MTCASSVATRKAEPALHRKFGKSLWGRAAIPLFVRRDACFILWFGLSLWLSSSYALAQTGDFAEEDATEPQASLSSAGITGLHELAGLTATAWAEGGNLRYFRQFEPSTGELRTYRARVYGGLGIQVGYQVPLTIERLSIAAALNYFHSLGFTSAGRRLGRTVPTRAQRMGGRMALQLRVVESKDSVRLSAQLGLARMGFDFDMAEEADMQLATGNYSYLEPGLGVTVPVGAFTGSLRLSYLAALSTGDFGNRKALHQPHGVSGTLVMHFAVLPALDLMVRSRATIWRVRLAPLPDYGLHESAKVIDTYISFGLGLRMHL